MDKSTKAIYQKKLQTLLRKMDVDKAHFLEIAISEPQKIKGMFYSVMDGLGKNSYPIYRQSIYQFLDEAGVDREQYDISGFSPKAESRRNSKKKKSYPEKIRREVLQKLSSKDKLGETDLFIWLHLQIGPYVGSRLIEYLSLRATEFGDKVEIEIVNGKRNEMRANGVVRKYVIDRFIESPVAGDIDIIILIEEMRVLLRKRVGLISEFDDEEGIIEKKDDMLSIIRTASNRHNELLKGIIYKGMMKPTLSSTRHQFKIGMSAVGDGLSVASCMGHASSETHERSYGNRKGGLKISKRELSTYSSIVPSQESLEKVRTPTALRSTVIQSK